MQLNVHYGTHLGFSEEISAMSTRLYYTDENDLAFHGTKRRTVAFTYADQFALAFGTGNSPSMQYHS